MSRVLTYAATIFQQGWFGSLMQPVQSSAVFLFSAIGVLISPFVARMAIVPAVMTLLGDHAWWIPKWLERRLPHISIEDETQE